MAFLFAPNWSNASTTLEWPASVAINNAPFNSNLKKTRKPMWHTLAHKYPDIIFLSYTMLKGLLIRNMSLSFPK